MQKFRAALAIGLWVQRLFPLAIVVDSCEKCPAFGVARRSGGAEITVKGYSVQPGNVTQFLIEKTRGEVPLDADWTSSSWAGAHTVEIAHFRPESSNHRPRTLVRLLYDSSGIHGMFHVEDKYVRCTRTNYFDDVWKDSCVEFFVEPKAGGGYFNFEFNCGGAFLCSHIIDPQRTPNGFKNFVKVRREIGQTIRVRSSLPPLIEDEIAEPVVWTLQFYVPFGLFEGFVGPSGIVAGQVWRGNFFKCAEEVSHPHWASWSPVDEFNFHLPRCFGTIRFKE